MFWPTEVNFGPNSTNIRMGALSAPQTLFNTESSAFGHSQWLQRAVLTGFCGENSFGSGMNIYIVSEDHAWATYWRGLVGRNTSKQVPEEHSFSRGESTGTRKLNIFDLVMTHSILRTRNPSAIILTYYLVNVLVLLNTRPKTNTAGSVLHAYSHGSISYGWLPNK